MPRTFTEEGERRVIWDRILESALKHHRRTKRYGMQKVIADDADLGTAAVSKWAKGLSTPEGPTLRRLADLYGVSAAWLGGDDASRGYGEFGAPNELLTRAGDITELVVEELLPEGSKREMLDVMRRVHDLLIEGKSEDEVIAQLFREVAQRKKN